MYLVLSHNKGIHGIDYTKGIDSDQHCGKIHKYQTVKCRPILISKPEHLKYHKSEDLVDYDSLSDEDKYKLGEPIFFMSSLHMNSKKTNA